MNERVINSRDLIQRIQKILNEWVRNWIKDEEIK